MARPLSVRYNVKDTAITVEGEPFAENYPSGSRSHLQCQSTMSPLPSQRRVWGNTSSQSDVTQGTVSAELHRASPPHQKASRNAPPQDIFTPLSVRYNVKNVAITVEGEHFAENCPSRCRSHLQCQSTDLLHPGRFRPQRCAWGNTSSQSDVIQGTVSAELHRASPPHQNASRTTPPQDISTVMQMPDQTHDVTRSAAPGTSRISPIIITNTPSQSGLTKQSQRMTRISMVLSVSFLLTFPQVALSLSIAMDLVDENTKSVCIVVELLALLSMSNHALNFWLYCLYWKEFRKRAIDLYNGLFKTLCCFCKVAYVR